MSREWGLGDGVSMSREWGLYVVAGDGRIQIRDLSTYEGEPSLQSQNTSKSQTKSKLQARRSKKNTKSSSQDQPPPADFHFMPTPGIEQSNAAVFDNNGPAVDAPVGSRHEKD
ncbi:Uncharacterized protein Fot_22468 [Forsythia ovata]|uniref:Uncharacterized protein n=1 Tax=Forsythia ovata TaxID=205694 RepID=A0ABD1UY37_9LAMI